MWFNFISKKIRETCIELYIIFFRKKLYFCHLFYNEFALDFVVKVSHGATSYFEIETGAKFKSINFLAQSKISKQTKKPS